MLFHHDIPYAFRQLRKAPAFTAIVVAALALGIGANTTVFTLANAVLFRGLPFPDADRIVHLDNAKPKEGVERMQASLPEFQDWRAQTKSFEQLAAYAPTGFTLAEASSLPERIRGVRVTANAFATFGIRPKLGRDFTAADEREGAPLVALISHHLWEERYGRQASVIGRQVRINERSTTIIGVMPEGFRFPTNHDLFVPIQPHPDTSKRDNRWVSAFGRLQKGRSIEDARAEMAVVAQALEKSYPVEHKNVTTLVQTFNDVYNGGPIKVVFGALLGAVALVLLVVIANVSNLMLARALGRSREVTIRAALGAGRWAIARQLLVESLILGAMGGVLGLGLAYFGIEAFSASTQDVGKPYWIEFYLDATVFAYFAVVCIVTGLLFGLVPAWQATRLDLASTMKESTKGAGTGRATRWITQGLVVSELALSLILLIGAGLMIRSFLSFSALTGGMPSDRILTVSLSPGQARYGTDAKKMQFADELLLRLRALPGVTHVGLSEAAPMNGASEWEMSLEGRPAPASGKKLVARGLAVTTGYFGALQRLPLQGRDFAESDGLPGKENVVVNAEFARRHYPRGSALGQRIQLALADKKLAAQWLTIVGVVPNIRQQDPMDPGVEPLVYVPARLEPYRWGFAILARTTVPPLSLVTPVRREVQALDADLPIIEPMTLADSFDRRRWAHKVFGSMFSIFSLIALGLASIGLYGVMSHAVRQRTAEIGIRLALGAGRGDILRMIVGGGMRQVALGLALGLAGAFGITRVIQRLLIQVSPTDPMTFVTLSAVLVLVALAACLIPARRAASIDPIQALRYE